MYEIIYIICINKFINIIIISKNWGEIQLINSGACVISRFNEGCYFSYLTNEIKQQKFRSKGAKDPTGGQVIQSWRFTSADNFSPLNLTP